MGDNFTKPVDGRTNPNASEKPTLQKRATAEHVTLEGPQMYTNTPVASKISPASCSRQKGALARTITCNPPKELKFYQRTTFL